LPDPADSSWKFQSSSWYEYQSNLSSQELPHHGIQVREVC
jgi:hypothetical protein